MCNWVADALFTKKGGMGTPKYLVVNDDNITNTREVVWAFATRNHPGPQGEPIIGDASTNPLVAYLGEDEKMRLRTPKVIYDCLDPEHLGGKLPLRSSFHHAYPKDLQTRVLRDWSAYGYPATTAAE